MSTLNFHKQNASYYYVIEEDENEEWSLKEEEIINALEKVGYRDIRHLNQWDNNNSKIIARKQIELNFISAYIEVILRAGYYTGSNLDWNYRYEDSEGNVIDIEEDYSSDFYDYLDEEDKEFAKKIKKEQTKIKRLVQEEIETLEKAFAKITTPYVLEGVFSNGEGVYHRLDGLDLIKKSKIKVN